MARYEDDNEKDYGFERGEKSRRGGSASDAKGYTKTTDFDTSKILKEDEGTYLGMKLSPGAASGLRFISNQFLPYISEALDKGSARFVESAAKRWVPNITEMRAAELGRDLGSKLGWGAIFYQQIADVGSTLYTTASLMNQLRTSVAPVLNANGRNGHIDSLYSDCNNEVICNARKKIYAIASHKAVETVSRAVSTIPQIFIKIDRQREGLHKYDEEKELEKVKRMSPQERIAYDIEKQKEVGQFRAGVEKQMKEDIAKRKEAYLKEYEDWKRSKGGKIALEEVRDELANSTYGNTSRMYGSDGRATDQFKKIAKQKEEDALKRKFGAENTPFDESWRGNTRGYYRGEGGSKTIVERIRDEYGKTIEEHIKEKAGKSKDVEKKTSSIDSNKTIMEQGMVAVGSVLSEVMGNVTGSSDISKYKNDIALDMILHMRRCLEEHAERETIPSRAKSARDRDSDMGFVKFVHSVFQKNQEDSGQSAINERYYNKFHENGWKDKDIFAMDDRNLSPYEVALKHIAQQIKNGSMDPLALVNLVGERRIVNKSGKAFGAEGKKGSDEDIKKDLVEEIEHQCALLKPKKKLDDAKLSEVMGDFTFTPEELKTAFGPNGLKDPEERAFIFALVEAHIPDEKALKSMTGLGDQELAILRKESQAHYSRLLDAAVIEFAEASKSNPEAMKQAKYTEDELKTLQKAAKDAEAAGKNVGDMISDREQSDKIRTTVTNYLMNSSKQDQGYWQRVVDRSRTVKVEKPLEQKPEDVRMARGSSFESKKSDHHKDKFDDARKHSSLSKHEHDSFMDDEREDDWMDSKPSYKHSKDHARPSRRDHRDDDMLDDVIAGKHKSRHESRETQWGMSP